MATKTITGTLTKNFSSYDTVNVAYSSISNVENAYTAPNSTYCTIYPSMGNGAETYIYFKFDLSSLASLPANTIITSITCRATVWITSSAYAKERFEQRYTQMCTGTTRKGNAITVDNSTIARTFTPGTWTVAELLDAGVVVYFKRTSLNSATSYQARVYGGQITVNYSYDVETGQDIFYKQNGSWVPVDTMYVKQNGSWIQVEEMLIKDNGYWIT